MQKIISLAYRIQGIARRLTQRRKGISATLRPLKQSPSNAQNKQSVLLGQFMKTYNN